MDFNDYISSIDKELEKELEALNSIHKDFVERLNGAGPIVNDKSTVSEPISNSQACKREKTIERLKQDPRLEESTQSKIGTFEKIYMNIYVDFTHRPIASYDYNEADYSPLVSLLASVLEIELNRSIYDFIKLKYKDEITQKYKQDKQEFDFDSTNQMLGSLMSLIRVGCDYLSPHIQNIDRFINLLKKMITVRNDASHGELIEKHRFLSFYSEYTKLFNDYILALLELKDKAVSSAKQTRSGKHKKYSYGQYSSYSYEDEKSDEEYVRSLFDDAMLNMERDYSSGILMTDCRKLSMKYCGNLYCVGDFYEMFNDIIDGYKAIGITYSLLDIGDKYDNVLEQYPGWIGYLKVLDEYCEKNHISSDNPQGLFIIGGDDVIPMPRVEHPYWQCNGPSVLEQTVDSDMLYAYDSNCVRISHQNKLSFTALIDNLMNPRFFVGRLPLENGMIKTRYDDDICGYIQRAIKAYVAGGVKISSPTFATCYNARNCGKLVVEGLPLKKLKDKPYRYESDMVVSPLTMLNSEKEKIKDCSIINDMVNNMSELDECHKEYLDTLSTSDMLIFLLHGGYTPNQPLYYGDAIKCDVDNTIIERCNPAAFAPTIFAEPNINIKIVSGVCCFGARFIDYCRDDSSLLTSIHKDTLLFYGASRNAYGSFDFSLEDSDGQIEYSLVQLKEFLQQLFAGVQAGIAIHKAKVEYAMHSIRARANKQRNEDNIGLYLTTLLEFNLFGDPLLNMQKIIDLPKKEMEELSYSDLTYDVNTERVYDVVYSAEKVEHKSILDRVRALVDGNFEHIHNKIKDTLYRHYSVDARNLYCARKYKDGSGNKGYSITYKLPDAPFDFFEIVDTDMNGNIKSIARTI